MDEGKRMGMRRTRRGWLLAIGLLLQGPAWAAANATSPAPADGACPAPVQVEPVYPEEMIRLQRGGEVVLAVTADACGRIATAEVYLGSGEAALDAAALAAVRQWVLSPQDRPRPGVRVRLPVAFDIAQARPARYEDANWPDSHRRARYLADTLPGYDTPAQVLDRYPLDPEAMITPPLHQVRNVFFRQRSDGAPEYWLFTYIGREARVAARYRLVTEDGEPVVRLAVVCSSGPDTCKRERKTLMRGLRFLK